MENQQLLRAIQLFIKMGIIKYVLISHNHSIEKKNILVTDIKNAKKQ